LTAGITLAGEPGPAGPLTGVTDALRRARLRAAAGFLVVTLAGLLGWRAVTAAGDKMLVLHAATVVGLGAALAVLSSDRPISGRGIRLLEVIVFGLTAAYLSAHQYDLMVRSAVAAGPGHEAAVLVAVKTTLIGTILLTFAYCMLIPNSWQEAALVAVAIVAVPVATELILFLRHPDVLDSAQRFADPKRVGEDVIIMLVAAGLSVYGTHVINTLRTEAFEARQLNQYRLGSRLGSGGMGEVYLAEHQLLKRPCALKMIRPDAASDPVTLARFEREVRAMARLSHPNTVEIYDYGRTDDGTFFYVMEYLRGLTLEELARRHGPMPPGRVIYLLRQVCGALAEAHAAGLIHRDVKPANIFACNRGGHSDVAKLLDFGLVRASAPTAPAARAPGSLAHPDREAKVRGTPLYMAPEQVTGARDLDHRCDLYAAGAVAYRLLTGRPPFEGDSNALVMSAQVHDPVAPPRLLRPDVPEDLERVVLRCLAKWPDNRYPNAPTLADALDACASAADWDADRADRWWREFEPDATSP
jgi:serine/threonine-protein kinase